MSTETSNCAMVGWRLEDAQAMNAANPTTFEIPSAQIRERHLQPGHVVKLVFIWLDQHGQDAPVPGERMWAEITEVYADGYRGTLRNTPCYSDALSPGDTICFGPQHIAAVTSETLMEILPKLIFQ